MKKIGVLVLSICVHCLLLLPTAWGRAKQGRRKAAAGNHRVSISRMFDPKTLETL